MTLYEFNLLDEMEQQEANWEGVMVADREDTEHSILLYQIDAFYVEVFYRKDLNMIRRYRSFSSLAQGEPYLNQINVDH